MRINFWQAAFHLVWVVVLGLLAYVVLLNVDAPLAVAITTVVIYGTGSLLGQRLGPRWNTRLSRNAWRLLKEIEDMPSVYTLYQLISKDKLRSGWISWNFDMAWLELCRKGYLEPSGSDLYSFMPILQSKSKKGEG